MMELETLSYATPVRRALFSWGAAVYGLAVVGVFLGVLWGASGWLETLEGLLGPKMPGVTRICIWLAHFFTLHGWHWPGLVGISGVWGVIWPQTGRGVGEMQMRWRRVVLGLAVWLMVVGFIVGMGICMPVIRFARENRIPAVRTDGTIHFAGWFGVYEWIAEDQRLGRGIGTAMEVCNSCGLTEYDFPGRGKLTLVEVDYKHELRGAQGNGAYVLILDDGTGDLVKVSPEDMGGNGFEFDGGVKAVTYWHMGGSETGVSEYQWDGHMFKLVSTGTMKAEEDDAQPGGSENK